MYQIVHGTTDISPDLWEFIHVLSVLGESSVPEARGLFDPDKDLIVSRAPGRLDVVGGIADYSGSLVLQLPIQEATFVALQQDEQRRLRIVTLSEDPTREPAFEMSLSDFDNDAGEPIDYDLARARLQTDAARSWAAYVAGVFLGFMRERGVRFRSGARILIASRVPEGKGVSSSAALEVATAQAVAAAFEISIDPTGIALLCQKVENHLAGAPCGVMDQMTAACGEANRLLALICQPAELLPSIPIPEGITFWGLDSGIRHDVAGEDYGSVRVGTFMGYRIIADKVGLAAYWNASGGHLCVDDPNWRGYLANLTPSEFKRSFSRYLPERISGDEFIAHYQGTTDPVTRVDPHRTYTVRAPTTHAILEHHRVRLFAEVIAKTVSRRRLELLGELMYQSHASYSDCGLGSARTDLLVQLVREAGPKRRLYGAKITGGGSGGTVAVLGQSDAVGDVVALAERYANETGYQPGIFSGSSPGSAAFGNLRLRQISR
jgi:galactokinase